MKHVAAWFPTLIYNAPLQDSGARAFNADLLEFAREKAKSATPGRRGSAEPASRAASSR